MKWDILIILFALYNCILIPFDVAFEPVMPGFLIQFEKIVDILFGLDILVAFKTTYIDTSTGLEVFEPKKIALGYVISGRFFVDMAASIPFEDIYMYFATTIEEGDGNLELKLLGLLKLIRLLRLGRIIRYLRFKQGLKVGIRMFQLLFFLLMLVHWVACVWFLVVKEPGSWVPPKDLDYVTRVDNDLWTRTDFYELSIQE